MDLKKKKNKTSLPPQVTVPFNVNLLPKTIGVEDLNKPASSKIDVSSQISSDTRHKLERFVQDGNNLDLLNDNQTNSLIKDNVLQSKYIFSNKEMNNSATDHCKTSLLTARKLNLRLTPLELQIVNIKEQYPDLLLIVECGYKYQVFGEVHNFKSILY